MINQDSNTYVNGIGYDIDIDLTAKLQLERIEFYTENLANSSVLELGVGDGVMLSKLEGYCSRLLAIDADETLLSNYCSKNPESKIDFKSCYFENFDTDECFDVIHMGFILEHVENPRILITKFLKYLKPSGKLFISVPNAESLHRRIGFYAGLLESVYKFSETDIKVGHVRYYDKKTLIQDIENGGGKVIALEGLFLKAISTSQIENLNLSRDVLMAFSKVGLEYPELSNSLFAVVQKKG